VDSNWNWAQFGDITYLGGWKLREELRRVLLAGPSRVWVWKGWNSEMAAQKWESGRRLDYRENWENEKEERVFLFLEGKKKKAIERGITLSTYSIIPLSFPLNLLNFEQEVIKWRAYRWLIKEIGSRERVVCIFTDS